MFSYISAFRRTEVWPSACLIARVTAGTGVAQSRVSCPPAMAGLIIHIGHGRPGRRVQRRRLDRFEFRFLSFASSDFSGCLHEGPQVLLLLLGQELLEGFVEVRSRGAQGCQ